MHCFPESDPQSLRTQLEELLQYARINEEKMQRMDAFERQLIASASLLELLESLLADYPEKFGLAEVSLSLIDPEAEVRRILGSEVAHAPWRDAIILHDEADALDAWYADGGRSPRLENFDPERHGDLFPTCADRIASVALIPLTRNNRVIGSLHFGSEQAQRYSTDCGTTLLERLAGIVAVCIENTLGQERLKQAGLTDGLTGVQNRRYFEHRCLVEVSQSRRYQHALACMFLDIDKFKRINDSYGHQTGDEVLRRVACVIQNGLRAGDTIARYGGEEFVVLLPQTSMLNAKDVAERIRRSIESADFKATNGQHLRVTLSIGLAMLEALPEGQEQAIQSQAERLVSEADHALYQAKENGRNRVILSHSAARSHRATALPRPGFFQQLKQIAGLAGLRL